MLFDLEIRGRPLAGRRRPARALDSMYGKFAVKVFLLLLFLLKMCHRPATIVSNIESEKRGLEKEKCNKTARQLSKISTG